MNMKLKFGSLSVVTGIGLVGLVAGCPVVPIDLCAGVNCEAGSTCDANTGNCVPDVPIDLCAGVNCETGSTCDADTGNCVPSQPDGFVNASATRGGSLYDKWWVGAGVDAPTDDHPFWATQNTNTRTGADTWRCKECHGWDYKGVDGAYGSGSHMTGFAGIFGTTLSAQEVFNKVKDDHGFGAAGLTDADVWDLAKFVLEGGQRDTDDIIDANGAFTGDAANGDTLYNGGIGSNLACMTCHGADGTQLLFDEGTVTIGGLADDNPWEFQHKVWYGQPGEAMPAAADVNATSADVADVGAHAQTLTTSTDPPGFQAASEARGGSLYDKWWVVAGAAEPTDDHPFWASQDTNTRTGADTWRCKECHGWDYKGVDGAYGSGSHMTGFFGIFDTTVSAQEAFDTIKTDHGFGDAGLTDDDIWDLAKFVLEGGQRDTDDIIDANGAFTGDAANGDTLYNNGIGDNTACMICHGADGKQLLFDGGTVTLGGLADDNPWEFQHKVWYGQPVTGMPAAVDVNATSADVADVGAHAQTLPDVP